MVQARQAQDLAGKAGEAAKSELEARVALEKRMLAMQAELEARVAVDARKDERIVALEEEVSEFASSSMCAM